MAKKKLRTLGQDLSEFLQSGGDTTTDLKRRVVEGLESEGRTNPRFFKQPFGAAFPGMAQEGIRSFGSVSVAGESPEQALVTGTTTADIQNERQWAMKESLERQTGYLPSGGPPITPADIEPPPLTEQTIAPVASAVDKIRTDQMGTITEMIEEQELALQARSFRQMLGRVANDPSTPDRFRKEIVAYYGPQIQQAQEEQLTEGKTVQELDTMEKMCAMAKQAKISEFETPSGYRVGMPQGKSVMDEGKLEGQMGVDRIDSDVRDATEGVRDMESKINDPMMNLKDIAKAIDGDESLKAMLGIRGRVSKMDRTDLSKKYKMYRTQEEKTARVMSIRRRLSSFANKKEQDNYRNEASWTEISTLSGAERGSMNYNVWEEFESNMAQLIAEMNSQGVSEEEGNRFAWKLKSAAVTSPDYSTFQLRKDQ